MNKVILIGRLTRDVEVRKTSSNLSVASFTVAINRPLSREAKEQGKEQEADFISCVAWRGSADFLGQYATKGSMLAVEGRLQTRNYEGQDGKKVYVTEVQCENVQLLHKQERNNQQDEYVPKAQNQEQTEMLAWGQPQNDLGINTDDFPFY